jgi:hypothetical protein
MATTIASGTLTVKLTEAVSLNGSDYSATNTVTVASINEITQRIVTIPPQELIILYEFGTVVGPGKVVYATAKYFRTTNKDSANPINLNLRTASTNQWVATTPGQTFMCSMGGSDGVASGTVVGPSLADITTITAYNPHASASVDIETYVAST